MLKERLEASFRGDPNRGRLDGTRRIVSPFVEPSVIIVAGRKELSVHRETLFRSVSPP